MYSGFCAAHTPTTRSIGAFSVAHTPSTRCVQAAGTAILSVVLEVRTVLDNPSILGVLGILGACAAYSFFVRNGYARKKKQAADCVHQAKSSDMLRTYRALYIYRVTLSSFWSPVIPYPPSPTIWSPFAARTSRLSFVDVLTLTHNTMQSVVAGQAQITLEWKKYLGKKSKTSKE